MKKLFAVLILSIFAFALCSTAYAWSPRDAGRPDAFDPGSTRGYFIWHDDQGFHLWTTTKGRQHHFSGVIRTDGQFIEVYGKRLETGNWFRVGPDGHKMRFDFTTAGGEDGVNFRIGGGARVSFDLLIDGHSINPQEIYIGHDGWHPEQSAFTLYR